MVWKAPMKGVCWHNWACATVCGGERCVFLLSNGRSSLHSCSSWHDVRGISRQATSQQHTCMHTDIHTHIYMEHSERTIQLVSAAVSLFFLLEGIRMCMSDWLLCQYLSMCAQTLCYKRCHHANICGVWIDKCWFPLCVISLTLHHHRLPDFALLFVSGRLFIIRGCEGIFFACIYACMHTLVLLHVHPQGFADWMQVCVSRKQ